jgi:hypothetical protein
MRWLGSRCNASHGPAMRLMLGHRGLLFVLAAFSKAEYSGGEQGEAGRLGGQKKSMQFACTQYIQDI